MRITQTKRGVEIHLRTYWERDEQIDSVEILFNQIDDPTKTNFDPDGPSITIDVNRVDEMDGSLINALKTASASKEEIIKQGSMLKDFLKTKKS